MSAEGIPKVESWISVFLEFGTAVNDSPIIPSYELPYTDQVGPACSLLVFYVYFWKGEFQNDSGDHITRFSAYS